MKRVYVNEKWCLGCHLCEYYCTFANSGVSSMVAALKDKPLRPRIRVEEHNGISFAVSCRHCKEPLCVKGCITGALSVKNGVITVDSNKCVGCYTCILSCPYGCISPDDSGHAISKCELCTKNACGEPACVKGCPNQAIVYEDRDVTDTNKEAAV